MKKSMFVMLFALLVVALAVAQPAYIPTTDTLGAHNNGGRGCAGCHAPHSGGRGAGGNSTTQNSNWVGQEGDQALWGTDLEFITAVTLNTGNGGKFVVNFGGAQQYSSTSTPLISGIALCLSCHDGNVSKGAMMMGSSYEGNVAGILPSGHGQGTYQGALYGTDPIPTLLGAETGGGVLGDYYNDHPIGPMANIGAVGSAALGNGLSYTVNGTKVTWTVAPGTQYATFVGNYGMPTVKAMSVDATNTIPYVTCRTCHQQHIMNVYRISSSTPIGGNTSGTVATYFFVKGPYNPGSAWTPTAAPSTTQFCRQCHFDHANENYGLNTITTAF